MRAGRIWVGMALACLCSFLLTVAVHLYWPHLQERLQQTTAPGGVRVSRVVDGDTLLLVGGERVRILNIDTAEMPPNSQCLAEERLALAAKARLDELTRNAERITLGREDRDRDDYGRLLRRVEVDGRDVGELLVAEKLARPWRGRRLPWC